MNQVEIFRSIPPEFLTELSSTLPNCTKMHLKYLPSQINEESIEKIKLQLTCCYKEIIVT